jgi:transcriptional regulator with XRE-family HTH domain
MPRRSPGARAKGIGAELRRLRTERQLFLRAVADTLGWDKARLSRIENGHQNQTVEDVAQLLVVYGVTDEAAQERMFDAVRSVDEPGWWEKTDGVTKESAALADYEAEASGLVSWAPWVVPGLLQTMDYAGALMEAYDISPDDIGLRLGARRERQRAVAGKPYTAYLGEPALRALVGGQRVMAAQLAGLHGRGDVTIRVVPVAAPAHLGMMGGFLLFRFPEAAPVVHVEMLASGVFQDDPHLTRPYETAVTQIDSVAMSETESARLIEQIRKELEG